MGMTKLGLEIETKVNGGIEMPLRMIRMEFISLKSKRAFYERLRDCNAGRYDEKGLSSAQPGKMHKAWCRMGQCEAQGEGVQQEPHHAGGEFNLNMAREFLANWDPKERSNQVKVLPAVLNRLLGSPTINPYLFKNLILRSPYREIRHTLSGPNSIAQWAHNQKGYHVSFPYAYMTREARIWLRIVCACLVPEKYMTHVTWERVCLVYVLMTGIPINVGPQIEEELVDYWDRYDPKEIDVINTKDPEGIHGPVLSIDEEQARVESDLESDEEEEYSEMGEAVLTPTDDED
ncbi:hypothetical protein HAX54_049138 [Datura stramonium]|uniref:Putative plant transposon protein domain-containing protein n=1 Tax=Datura stramonium TaxID=4076 RepID=A0ABS8SUJ9_DATST|nr:hypothetical protein [Datura stramonium]